MSQVEFYQEQVERAQQLASLSTLPNVRARYAESAETWGRLRDRAERLEVLQESSRMGMGRSPRV